MKKPISKQPILEIVNNPLQIIREALEARMQSSVLRYVHDLCIDEVERICGKAFERKKSGKCHRAGSDPGTIKAKGQRLKIRKPRVKKNGKEVGLDVYQALQGFDCLNDKIMQTMLVGVSTRNYDSLLDEFQGGLGLSKSTVSRVFQRGSQQSLDELNGLDLTQHEWFCIMIDGIHFASAEVVVALGIDLMGHKHILGLREGMSENSEVCKDLLESLIARGLPKDASGILFVIDGSKALRSGIQRIYGDQVHVQRCIRHKERNIVGYLPKRYHLEFLRKWKKIHGLCSYAGALQEMQNLHGWLANISHAAASSLEEAEDETLTVIKFGASAELSKTLLSTNPIENVFDKVRTKSSRVKNWKTSKTQVSRWSAFILTQAQKKFRRIKGYSSINLFVTNMKNNLMMEKVAA